MTNAAPMPRGGGLGDGREALSFIELKFPGMPMLAQLSRSAVASSLPIPGAETFGRETSPWRVALVAPPGLFRDGFARLIVTWIAEIRLECHDSVEDVVPGSARLGLLAFDPSASSREALSAKIEALRARCDGAPIGVVTPDDRAPGAAGLGALGVAGVVSLSAGVEVAVAAVRLMSVGGYCLPPEALPAATRPVAWDAAEEAATEPLVEDASAIDERASLRSDLTARERDVLRSLRSGHQNKIIAYELGISQSTVKVHLRNIMKKLNASNRTQVALGGPPLFDRSTARAYAAVGSRDEFDRGLPERAHGVLHAEAEADIRPLV
jgi:DNA-binding NarL/FixJ family response regulator